jgi:protein-tyrosine phosphatase
MKEQTRHLRWESCYNIRDLGGYPTRDGGQTRFGTLVRADVLSRLTPIGRAALLDYGVRTVIDLRSPEELALDPNPFASPGEHDRHITYHNLQLGAGADPEGIAAVHAADEREDYSLAFLYHTILNHYGRGIAAIMRTIATAADGAVLFHCYAGKDRTGLIAALLLALADVPAEVIAEDYALTQDRLRPVFDAWIDDEPDPIQRARLAHQLGAAPETMLALLEHLATSHDGAEAYLRAAGMAPNDIGRLLARLRG